MTAIKEKVMKELVKDLEELQKLTKEITIDDVEYVAFPVDTELAGFVERSIEKAIQLTEEEKNREFSIILDLIQKKANQLRSNVDIRDMNVIINLVRNKIDKG